jgi:hypothetical protein
MNHDYLFKEIIGAIEKIQAISSNKINSSNLKNIYDQAASLAVALDEFDVSVIRAV